MQAGLVTKKYRVMAAGLLIMAQITPKDNPNNIICDNPIEETYDFIIAGGGTAGSVLAARLSEDVNTHVLLLESGGTGTAYTEWPAMTRFVYDTKKWDWRYKNVRDEGYCFGMKDKVCKLSRGRMLGGQSSFNRMMYVRGNRNDFDLWKRLGNPGWGYGDVLPYFIRAEDNLDHRLKHSPYHGVGGPMKVSSPERHQLSGLASLWLKAAIHNKFEVGDINGDKQTRFMLHQTNTAYGERWSTARAYLAPASHRTNLDILTEAHVTRIIVDPKTQRAKGVIFYKDKKRRVAWARKEVIVSAGTFSSPQLLKLSGIGPCGELKKHGIYCKKNLPGVGENLQSHFGIGGIDFLVARDGMKGPAKALKNPVYKKQYINKRIGPLASVMGLEGTGFISTSYNNISYGQDWPDVQFLFFSQHTSTDGYYEALIYGLSYKLWQTFYPNKFTPGYRILPVNLRPRSRGKVALRSRNPWQHPDIFLNLFDDPHDLAVLREAGQKAEAIGLSLPFIRAGASAVGEKNRFCYLHPTGGPDWWDCRARVFPETLYQETSTCKMGPPSDPMAVVDNQLRVYGISGLRVVDASIMPTIVSGDASAATVMIAERAADMIRAFWHGIRIGTRDPAGFVEETVMNLRGAESETSPAFGLADLIGEGQGQSSFGTLEEQLLSAGDLPTTSYLDTTDGVETTYGTTQTTEVATPTTEEATTVEMTEEAVTTEEATTQTTSMMPETTATTVTEPAETETTETTQQTTQPVPETTHTIPETTTAAVTEPVQTEAPTKSTKIGYTIHMGGLTKMSGTFVVKPTASSATTEESKPTTEKASYSKSTSYDDEDSNAYLDYDKLSDAEIFGEFPDVNDENYGGFLGPINDYSGYTGGLTVPKEEFEAVSDRELIPQEEYGTPLGDVSTSSFKIGTPFGSTEGFGYDSSVELGKTSSYEADISLEKGFGASPSPDKTPSFGSALSYGDVPKYGSSLGNTEPYDFGSSLNLGETVEYSQPLAFEYTPKYETSQKPETSSPQPETDQDMNTEKPTEPVQEEFGMPRESDIVSDYGAPLESEITTDYGTPFQSEIIRDYGAPLQSEIVTDYGPPKDSDTTEDYGVPRPSDIFGDYGPPKESHNFGSYGAPFNTDQSIGFATPVSYEPVRASGNTQQNVPFSTSQSPQRLANTQNFNGYGDYSMRPEAEGDIASEAPSIEEETTERPAAGAGLLQDNIKRLKEEMRMLQASTTREVIATERPKPRFDARGGTTGEPRTYSSVYTDGFGDGMENTFGGYRTRQMDGGGKKREVVDEFVAEASVGHATVFQRVGEPKDGSKSEDDAGRKSQTPAKEDEEGALVRRRKIMQNGNGTSSLRNAEEPPKTPLRIQHNVEAKTESEVTQNRGKVTFAPRRNAGRATLQANKSNQNSRSRAVFFQTRTAKPDPTTARSTIPHSRRNSATNSTTRRGRTRTWDIAIVTRAPKVSSNRQDRRVSNSTRSRTSSRQQTERATEVSKLTSKKERTNASIATFDSKRVHGIRFVVNDTDAKNRRRTSSLPRNSSTSDKESSASAKDWTNADASSGSWGERNQKSL
ncbi:uncharacterized protein LOC122375519 [Amphibalanus amphitrite]|uniref:uncharacterized protein LOC122375519 n=1 Tax=Amphibalanus amphitrite TaxID=1232801 RepID=UPI001C923345|nr:uncharacterized protein LOC122375519 [Amphibalanus amphitrite]